MSPYWNTTFFSFFGTLFKRLFTFSGPLASDELQLCALLGVAISAAVVGSFLVLKRMAMVANSLSHTILLGIIVAYLLGGGVTAMLFGALAVGLLTTYLTELLHRVGKVQEDASNGLVFSTLFALGIVLASMTTRNAHIGLDIVMGNVDALHSTDLTLIGWVVMLNLVVVALFFRPLKLTTFDPSFARSIGIPVALFNTLLMIQTALTVVGAFRAVGVVMVLAFLVGPPLAARNLTNRLVPMIILSAAIGSLASILGVALSRHILTAQKIPLSTGGLVVCLIGAFYALSLTARLRSPRLNSLLNLRPIQDGSGHQ